MSVSNKKPSEVQPAEGLRKMAADPNILENFKKESSKIMRAFSEEQQKKREKSEEVVLAKRFATR